MTGKPEGLESLPGLPPGQAAKKPEVDRIEEIVGAIFDPIIVFPSSWMETIPDWMKKDMPLHRLAHNMMCAEGLADWEEACDLEALVYMYPLTLDRPIAGHWAHIYVYLGTQVMRDNMPDDIKREALTDYEKRELQGLKRWIYQEKVKTRKARHRQEKDPGELQQGTEIVSKEYEQSRLF